MSVGFGPATDIAKCGLCHYVDGRDVTASHAPKHCQVGLLWALHHWSLFAAPKFIVKPPEVSVVMPIIQLSRQMAQKRLGR
jgi:hypothetical protein